jgi:poly(3-hydroxyalkanoate) depolymerase
MCSAFDRHAMTEISVLDVDGQRLRIARCPGRSDIPPLLLINGLGASLELLEPFTQALNGIETIRIDLPGTGGSPAPAIPYRPHGLAVLLRKVLDRFGDRVVDALGISLGGAIVQQLAWQYADRIRRLVLVSTGTGAVMVPGTPLALLSMLTPRRFIDANHMIRIAPYLYGGRVRTKPNLATGFQRSLKPDGLRGYYWQLLGLVGWTSVHWLSQVRQPTLILSGADDPIVPPVNARIMARLMPNARLHIFDDGHLGLITSADELAPLVRGFLAATSVSQSDVTGTA